MPYLVEKKGWDDLAAVKNNEVYLIDFEFFTQPSASTLVEGIELLASVKLNGGGLPYFLLVS